MNDLMTKSFLSYVELKKQVQTDLKSETDIEKGPTADEQTLSLSVFFKEVDSIKSNMEDITRLFLDLQTLNEESKSTHTPKLLRGLRDRMDSNMASILRKAHLVKARLESLDSNRKNGGAVVDQTRVLIASGLRAKLRVMMNEFQLLRERILSDYKETLRRKYFNENGVVPSEAEIEQMVVLGSGRIEVFGERNEIDSERRESVMEIQRSLNRLHQVFLDMAVLVGTQGELINDIEHNVAEASRFVGGGTNSLYYANQMKKKGKMWVFWVCGVGIIILLVCFIAMLSS